MNLALEGVSSNFLALCCCRPLRGAAVDLWHADEKDEYDNIGFRYRGHVISGPDGAFRFRTIMPALYSGPRGTTTSRFKRREAVY